MLCLHMDNYLECEKFSNFLCLVLVYCQMGIASSSAFLLICGTNEFIYDLRILTAFELFENCQAKKKNMCGSCTMGTRAKGRSVGTFVYFFIFFYFFIFCNIFIYLLFKPQSLQLDTYVLSNGCTEDFS